MALLAACAATPAQAHHGQEFLVVQDAAVPSMWSGTIFGGVEWSRDGSEDELSAEPGLMLGVGSRVALGTTLGFSGTDRDWSYESIAPFLQVQVTPPAWPVRVAVIAGYHFADHSTQPDTVALRQEPIAPPVKATALTPQPRPVISPPPNPDPDPPCGPEFGPDAPPCPEVKATTHGRNLRHAGHTAPTPATPPTVAASSSAGEKHTGSLASSSSTTARNSAPVSPYDGIHRHGEDHTFARLIVEADLSPADKLIFNLIALWPDEGRSAWGYAAGYRHAFTHSLAAGIEAIGDCGDANEHELVLGGYLSPSHSLSFKFGTGFGLTSTSPEFSLRTGMVWRF